MAILWIWIRIYDTMEWDLNTSLVMTQESQGVSCLSSSDTSAWATQPEWNTHFKTKTKKTNKKTGLQILVLLIIWSLWTPRVSSDVFFEKNVILILKRTDWILTCTEAHRLRIAWGKSQSARWGLASQALGSVPGGALWKTALTHHSRSTSLQFISTKKKAQESLGTHKHSAKKHSRLFAAAAFQL